MWTRGDSKGAQVVASLGGSNDSCSAWPSPSLQRASITHGVWRRDAVWDWGDAVIDHVLPITESLTALQGLREMLQTLSAGSCPALSVPPVHPPPPPLPHGAFLILSTLHSLPRILPFFARPSLALPSPYPSTLPTWWTCSCPLKLVFISPPPSNLSPPLM